MPAGRPAVAAVRLPLHASLLLMTTRNPLWIALTAPARWVSDRFGRLLAPAQPGAGLGLGRRLFESSGYVFVRSGGRSSQVPHPALRIVLGIRRRGERQVGGPAESSSLRTHGRFEATKASTDVLTRALALELHERTITVNAVSLESHRSCAPSRIADVIAYLLSEHGHHLIGRVLDPGLRAAGT